MSFCEHAFEQFGPDNALVEFTSAVVVACDHECGLGSGSLKCVEQLIGVVAWAIVEGQSNRTGHLAIRDELAVLDVAKLWSSIFESAWSRRDDV